MSRQLAALRGLAILLVVFNHSIHMQAWFCERWTCPPIEGWERYIMLVLSQIGLFAVPIFLFISGCFATYMAQSNPARLSWKPIWNGLGHTLWPYFFWSVVFYILLYLGYGERYSLTKYLTNLVVGYPYNFVPLFVFWYVMSPLLVYVSKRWGWAPIGIIALYQLTLINFRSPGILGFTFPIGMRFIVPPVLGQTMTDWGIYFPLGVAFSVHSRSLTPWLQKWRYVFMAVTVVLFVLGVLDTMSILRFPLAIYLCPFMALFFAYLVKRESVPKVRYVEYVGNRSYGIYLMNLIVLDCILLAIEKLSPLLLYSRVLLLPFLFILTLGIPLAMMSSLARLSTRPVYRYVFG